MSNVDGTPAVADVRGEALTSVNAHADLVIGSLVDDPVGPARKQLRGPAVDRQLGLEITDPLAAGTNSAFSAEESPGSMPWSVRSSRRHV